MGGPHLLPGEREEVVLRPGPLGHAGLYALALAPAAFGLGLWALSETRGWRAAAPADASGFSWGQFVGTPFALAFYTVFAIVAAAAVHFLLRRRAVVFVWAAAALGLLMGAAALVPPAAAGQAVPILVAVLCIPAFVGVEARRLGTRYIITNLRLIETRAWPRAECSVLFEDIVDLAAQPRWGTDSGRIVPVAGPARRPARVPRLVGIRPFGRVRDLLVLLIQRATASDFLRAEGRLEQKAAEARAALLRK
jgi:hypothetical protein